MLEVSQITNLSQTFQNLTTSAEEEVSDISNILKAIANPKRLSILLLLSSADMKNYQDLIAHSELGKTALANHLNILEKEGMIDRLSRGNYQITKKGQDFVNINLTMYEMSYQGGTPPDQQNGRLQPYKNTKATVNNYCAKSRVTPPALTRSGENSILASLAGIYAQNSIECDYIQAGGISGINFANYFTRGEINLDARYKYIAWEQTLHRLDPLGIAHESFQIQQSYPTYHGTLTSEDINRAQSIFNMIRQEIDANRMPIVLYGISTPEYGIINGYYQEDYIAHANHPEMGMCEYPVPYYSLKAPAYVHAIFFHKKDPNPAELDYLAILEGCIALAEGNEMPTTQDQAGAISGPDIFNHWAEILTNALHLDAHEQTPNWGKMNSDANHILADFYAEARANAAAFLLQLAKKYDRKTQGFLLGKAGKEYQIIAETWEHFKTSCGDLMSTECRGEACDFTATIQHSAAFLFQIAQMEQKAIQYLKDARTVWQ